MVTEKKLSYFFPFDELDFVNYEWLVREFADWAFTFVSAFLYYQNDDVQLHAHG